LQESLESLEAAGIQVVGVSPDSVDVLEKFSTSKNLGFPLLADVDSETIKAFGIHNTKGLPHPGTIIVDKTGAVKAKIFREGHRDRHPAQELIDEVTKFGEN
jgi:peroxiredoxin Q/BCP